MASFEDNELENNKKNDKDFERDVLDLSGSDQPEIYDFNDLLEGGLDIESLLGIYIRDLRSVVDKHFARFLVDDNKKSALTPNQPISKNDMIFITYMFQYQIRLLEYSYSSGVFDGFIRNYEYHISSKLCFLGWSKIRMMRQCEKIFYFSFGFQHLVMDFNIDNIATDGIMQLVYRQWKDGINNMDLDVDFTEKTSAFNLSAAYNSFANNCRIPQIIQNIFYLSSRFKIGTPGFGDVPVPEQLVPEQLLSEQFVSEQPETKEYNEWCLEWLENITELGCYLFSNYIGSFGGMRDNQQQIITGFRHVFTRKNLFYYVFENMMSSFQNDKGNYMRKFIRMLFSQAKNNRIIDSGPQRQDKQLRFEKDLQIKIIYFDKDRSLRVYGIDLGLIQLSMTNFERALVTGQQYNMIWDDFRGLGPSAKAHYDGVWGNVNNEQLGIQSNYEYEFMKQLSAYFGPINDIQYLTVLGRLKSQQLSEQFAANLDVARQKSIERIGRSAGRSAFGEIRDDVDIRKKKIRNQEQMLIKKYGLFDASLQKPAEIKVDKVVKAKSRMGNKQQKKQQKKQIVKGQQVGDQYQKFRTTMVRMAEKQQQKQIVKDQQVDDQQQQQENEVSGQQILNNELQQSESLQQTDVQQNYQENEVSQMEQGIDDEIQSLQIKSTKSIRIAPKQGLKQRWKRYKPYLTSKQARVTDPQKQEEILVQLLTTQKYIIDIDDLSENQKFGYDDESRYMESDNENMDKILGLQPENTILSSNPKLQPSDTILSPSPEPQRMMHQPVWDTRVEPLLQSSTDSSASLIKNDQLDNIIDSNSQTTSFENGNLLADIKSQVGFMDQSNDSVNEYESEVADVVGTLPEVTIYDEQSIKDSQIGTTVRTENFAQQQADFIPEIGHIPSKPTQIQKQLSRMNEIFGKTFVSFLNDSGEYTSYEYDLTCVKELQNNARKWFKDFEKYWDISDQRLTTQLSGHMVWLQHGQGEPLTTFINTVIKNDALKPEQIMPVLRDILTDDKLVYQKFKGLLLAQQSIGKPTLAKFEKLNVMINKILTTRPGSDLDMENVAKLYSEFSHQILANMYSVGISEQQGRAQTFLVVQQIIRMFPLIPFLIMRNQYLTTIISNWLATVSGYGSTKLAQELQKRLNNYQVQGISQFGDIVNRAVTSMDLYGQESRALLTYQNSVYQVFGMVKQMFAKFQEVFDQNFSQLDSQMSAIKIREMAQYMHDFKHKFNSARRQLAPNVFR